jgi:hypothetical protein
MKNVYYFQRYSQRENWATNNTLLLLSRLYQFNRLKFQRAIKEILGQGIELDIGSACGVQIMKPLVFHASSKATSQKHRRVLHLEFNTMGLPNGLEWAEKKAVF